MAINKSVMITQAEWLARAGEPFRFIAEWPKGRPEIGERIAILVTCGMQTPLAGWATVRELSVDSVTLADFVAARSGW